MTRSALATLAALTAISFKSLATMPSWAESASQPLMATVPVLSHMVKHA